MCFTYMKLHSIGQDLQDYQDIFGLEMLYLVHPACPAESGIDPVKKGKCGVIKFHFRSNRLDWRLRWVSLATFFILMALLIRSIGNDHGLGEKIL